MGIDWAGTPHKDKMATAAMPQGTRLKQRPLPRFHPTQSSPRTLMYSCAQAGVHEGRELLAAWCAGVAPTGGATQQPQLKWMRSRRREGSSTHGAALPP